jgi:nicotinate phosphoribosyltransferase
MNVARDLYRHSLALLTDLYELTMAYGYWKLGLADKQAAFHLAFRDHPFGGGFTVACGLSGAVGFLDSFRFDEGDLEYLAGIEGNDGRRIFEGGFLDYLRGLELRCDVDAVAEGTVVFPHEPLVRVTGPLLPCQIVETALLNLVNFPTLIATKAARVCLAAEGEPVLDFGLRRAQGIDGGIAASRAAFVGGCAGTSNVLAGKLFGIPVKGTHAHSWVMVFDEEIEAFRAYAEALPNNCIFLVDTYETLRGVRNAVEVGKELRDRGSEMIGIRLDSGDLASLSREARKILDAAGMHDAGIVGSGDLDEHAIARLKEQHAAINLWGVGTRLVTAWDDPALGGVYKLTAVRGDDGRWDYRIKLSEQAVKMTTPGVLGVRRHRRGGRFVGDAIYDEQIGIERGCTVVDPEDATRTMEMPAGADCDELLVPVFRAGRRVYDVPSAAEARRRCMRQLEALDAGVKRRTDPEPYPVGLEKRLSDLKARLIAEAREAAGA